MPETETVGSRSIEDAFHYYLRNQADFVEKYNGKVVAIKGEKVLGVYDDHLTALKATSKDHEVGTFLLQLVSEGSEAYTASFRSRVTLPAE